MEDNQDKKQDGGKGLLIIIAIVILAAAAYFIVQGVNKKDKGSNQPTVSISEEDKLELSSLNLQGIWNKTVGADRYELNFKMTKELVLTQYDKNGEVAVKSDEGTYSVDNGVLNLTVVANGQTSTAAATAVLSDKYLIITVTEGSTLFAGTYTADRGDMPNVDISSTVESAENSDITSSSSDISSENSSQSDLVQSSNTTSSAPASSADTEISTPTVEPQEIHLPSTISYYLSISLGEVISASETDPVSDARGMTVTLNSYRVKVWNNAFNPEYENKLLGFCCPIQMFFSYPSSNPTFPDVVGKEEYTYEELKAMLGDKLSYVYSDEGEVKGYVLSAMIDGYKVYFGDKEYAWYGISTLDTPLTYCQIDVRQQ